MRETIRRLSRELGLSEATITKTYKAYWLFIKETIGALPLKEELTEEEYSKLKTNFNIPNLGKLACPYQRWQAVKNKSNKLREIRHAKHKGNSTNVQLLGNNQE